MIKISVLTFLYTFFYIVSLLGAGKKDESAQTKEIIEIAQNLILQKDREQAIRILNKAYAAEKNKTMQNEIKNILTDIGSLFLFDKAQQEYEFSVNFKKTDPSKWLATVEKAQKIEPDNTLIMSEVVRSWVNKKDINKAKEVLEEFRLKNPYDRNVILGSIFVALANNDIKEVHLVKSKLKDMRLRNFELISSYLEFLEIIKLGNHEKSVAALEVFKKEDAQNPQIPYWEARLSGKVRTDGEPICASFPEHYYRRYRHDLYFCSPALDFYFKFKGVKL